NIFIISGPSGAGEDSIIKGLRKHFPIESVVTTTTRNMRPGESNGNPYWFVLREEFEKRRDNGEFVEWAEQYNSNLYGVTKKEIERIKNSGKVGIWKIDYKGVITAKKVYPEIPAIFITVPSLDILEKRIRNRDYASEEYIKERMEYTREWMKHKDIYDYTIINEEGKLDKAIKEAVEIIKSNIKNG
ncbi:MAG TPA: guanylate kinase, partial [Candidatus Moranbacteria bacterium]|nr:guanylate kinase [Candidatus Moranbacteria bacterium]